MNSSSSTVAVIILAGGTGSRMGSDIEDKVLLLVRGKPVIQYSIEAFAASLEVSTLVLVARSLEQGQQIEKLVPKDSFREVITVLGGAKRQDSVMAGLSALPRETDIVLIHDGARPLVTPSTIDSVARAARTSKAACVGRKIVDTIKQVEPSKDGFHLHTIDRSKLWAMETPQAFQYSIIASAYRKIIESGRSITDDLGAIEDKNLSVTLIENEVPNPKLTTVQDIPYLEYLLSPKTQT